MKTLEEKIAVMQAAAAGKLVQAKDNHDKTATWECVISPVWNWSDYDFRIAPDTLTIYIYKNQTNNQLFPSSGPINVSYTTLIKTIEVEV